MSFWGSWQLWQKMCFILGCGIVCVIILGIVKLTYNNWRISRYSKIRAEKIATRKEMQHAASVKRGRGKDIPFGVRALEKGVEVDGVWYSGANTPATVSLYEHGLARSDTSHGALDSSPTSVRSATYVPAQANSSRSPSPDEPVPLRQTYQPRQSSGLRYSDSHELEMHTSPESSPDLRVPARHRNTAAINSSPESSPDLRLPTRGPHAHYQDWTGESSAEEIIMEQSARRPSRDKDYQDRRSPTAYHHHRYSPSPNRSQTSNDDNDPFLTPNMTNSPIDRSTSLPSVDDLVPKTDKANDSIQHAQMIRDSNILYDNGHAQPYRAFEKSHSGVIRKVNSGFEILKPGTLGDAQPVTLEAAFTDQDETARSRPKKLQRKGQRNSVISVTSAR